MPTYEFVCRKCGETFEVVTSMNECERMKRERTLECAHCRSNDVELQISEFEVQTTRKSA